MCGIVRNKYYPIRYPIDEDCKVYWTVDSEQRIQLSFTDFDLPDDNGDECPAYIEVHVIYFRCIKKAVCLFYFKRKYYESMKKEKEKQK